MYISFTDILDQIVKFTLVPFIPFPAYSLLNGVSCWRHSMETLCPPLALCEMGIDVKFPLAKTSNAISNDSLWLTSQSVEQTVDSSVIWDMTFMSRHRIEPRVPAKLSDNTWTPIQYKDAVLPVKEIPLWN